MSKTRRWLVLATVSAGLLMVSVDTTVLYTALPTLTGDLHADASQKLWIINAYPLVMAGLLLGAGTLGDRIGHKRMYLTGLALFAAASLLAAFAPSPPVLIAARAFLAVGAAAMLPATAALIRITFDDDHERGIAIGVWGTMAVLGAALGPITGGLLLQHFWWGSVFLLNIPVVLLALAATAAFVPGGSGHRDRPWDLIASLQAMIALAGLVYAIQEATRPGPMPLAIAGALLAAALVTSGLGYLLLAPGLASAVYVSGVLLLIFVSATGIALRSCGRPVRRLAGVFTIDSRHRRGARARDRERDPAQLHR